MTRLAFALSVLAAVGGCVAPCTVRNAPGGMRAEIADECEAQRLEFGIDFAVSVRPTWWFGLGNDLGFFPEAFGETIGTARPRLRPPRVVISETAFEVGRWRTVMCHEVQHLLDREHECFLCEYEACVGRDER